jgi:hypothetical protein
MLYKDIINQTVRKIGREITMNNQINDNTNTTFVGGNGLSTSVQNVILS